MTVNHNEEVVAADEKAETKSSLFGGNHPGQQK